MSDRQTNWANKGRWGPLTYGAWHGPPPIRRTRRKGVTDWGFKFIWLLVYVKWGPTRNGTRVTFFRRDRVRAKREDILILESVVNSHCVILFLSACVFPFVNVTDLFNFLNSLSLSRLPLLWHHTPLSLPLLSSNNNNIFLSPVPYLNFTFSPQ